MASASYCEDLTCAICLTIFTDPVTLVCGHSFCRGCITDALSSQQQCPQCRRAVPAEVSCLPTGHILKSLAEKAKEAEKIKKEHDGKQKAEVAELCPEHEEKLKLFCVTDQQLACIICRDGERHEGHKFKPIKEAAASLRKELEKCLEDLCGHIPATESLANTQREEISNTKERSQQLTTQIHRQFEEMHKFLRKREDEIKNELKYKEEDAVEKMSKSLNAIETHLSKSRMLEGKLTSVLRVEDSERFLKSWTEGHSRMRPEDVFKPRAHDLKVVNTSLSLGPYESHLQFFMWKEMLQVIQPRAELLSLKSNSADITVSDDGRSLFCSPKSDHTPSSCPSCVGFGSPQNTARPKTLVWADPVVKPKAEPLVWAKPVVKPKAEPLVWAKPMVKPKAEPLVWAKPVVKPKAEPLVWAKPVVKPTAEPLIWAELVVEPKAEPLVWAELVVEPKAEPLVWAELVVEPKAEPKLRAVPMGSCEDHSLSSSSSTNHAFSVDEFTSGQHYLEIDVGQRDYWELGITNNYLKYDAKKYSTCIPDLTTELEYEDRPRKIGIYLNCTSQKLSFYNADNMTHIHTLSSGLMSKPLSAYVGIRSREQHDRNPLTVCWY